MDYSRVVNVRKRPHNDQVQIFESNQGARIAQLPLNAFPDFWVYAYVALADDYRVLIDTGSGFYNNNQSLVQGMKNAGEILGECLRFSDLTHILITHGHIDHFGGLPFVRQQTSAKIGVHELDRQNLTHTEQRLAIAARRLKTFLIEAGIDEDETGELVEIYKLTKLDYVPGPVDFTFEAEGMRLGPFEMFHTPGHCAGQVLIRLHDILFSGDHILAEISPHQAPEQIMQHTGLSHYLQSLQASQRWANGIRLTLGGHNDPITDLQTRIGEIQAIHQERLQDILLILKEPATTAEVSQTLFGEAHGYNILLALEEAGAHVEYLYQRGLLFIANANELANTDAAAPIYYQALGLEAAQRERLI